MLPAQSPQLPSPLHQTALQPLNPTVATGHPIIYATAVHGEGGGEGEGTRWLSQEVD